MEFCEKLQELRKRSGLSQEELAERLYVSRTAISKWESGRGYPSIDSLKAIAKHLSVSLDELLSNDALLSIAEEEAKQRESRVRSLVFGLLDCSAVMLLLLPFFGQRTGGSAQAVTLPSLTTAAPYGKAACIAAVICMMLWGVLMLVLKDLEHSLWRRSRYRVSMGISVGMSLLFIACLQPYAALFTFVLLAIKALLLIRWE